MALAVCGSLLLTLLAAGCSRSEGALAIDVPPAEAVQPGRPEQVVQRINPAPGAVSSATLAGKGGGSDSEASTTSSANGAISSASGSASSASGQTITPKHLEAELNRLEAELNH